jgi:hypothetical protein
LQILANARPLAVEVSQQVSRDFYSQMGRSRDMMQVVHQHSSIERLSKTLSAYFVSLFDGKVDEAYVSERIRVGKVHYRIGVPPDWYSGMFPAITESFMRLALQQAVQRVYSAITATCVAKMEELKHALHPSRTLYGLRMPAVFR